MISGHEVHSDRSLHISTLAFTRATGADWPDATRHPLFYTGIYATIGLVNVHIGIMAMIAQYTGALRASRAMFRFVIILLCFICPDLVDQAAPSECSESHVPISRYNTSWSVNCLSFAAIS